jgi:hypothetical protein
MINKRFFPKEKGEQLQFIIAILLQLAILLVITGSFFRQQWLVAFTGSAVLILTFLPAIIARQFKIRLPIEFSLVICLFLYASFGLGEASHFYQKYWWWDLMLHSFSSLVMGLTGFLLIYVFYMTHRIRIAPIYVSMVSFGLAVTIGTLWEVFEFLMDWFFGLNMQKSGLVDTMTDLLVNIVGGVIAALIGYIYVKGGDSLIADRIIRNFIKNNPHLFPPDQQQD